MLFDIAGNGSMGKRPVLVVAHPGHEVLLHGWLEQSRPLIMIITDGSGRSGQPRIAATRKFLQALGLDSGPLFGRFTDQDVYKKILEQDFDFFNAVADEVCKTLMTEDSDYVVADAAEGYNSVHDVCRLIVDCAVSMLQRITGRSVKNFEYPVTARLTSDRSEVAHSHKVFVLDAEALERKLRCAAVYYPELLVEMSKAFPTLGDVTTEKTLSNGREMFGEEYLRECSNGDEYGNELNGPPFYERWGDAQVAKGNYSQTIRYAEHMLPIANSLWRHSCAARASSV